jgi:crossover junction endodeoxyribonuclease RuvC
MKIIGIDPGYGRVGFGLIEKTTNYEYISSGIISTKQTENLYDRLNEIEQDLDHILTIHKPEFAVVEKLFFSKNTTTAMQVSEARGVICNLLNKKGIQIQEVSPSQIKSTLTGNGNATKPQVEKMVKIHLKSPNLEAIDDAMDALAAAICFRSTQI